MPRAPPVMATTRPSRSIRFIAVLLRQALAACLSVVVFLLIVLRLLSFSQYTSGAIR
jgi:hypothetical protein